jgi:hypothetical protein
MVYLSNISKLDRYPMGSNPIIPTQWYSFFNDSCWQATPSEPQVSTWTGSAWLSGDNYLSLDPIGIWSIGFRPTLLRITSPLNIVQLFLYDTTHWIPFLVSHNVEPGATIVTEAITFYGNDIGRIFATVEDGVQFQVTNIEFYG